ncbi:MAG: KH domain-containing protein, partial [Bacteroidales bacterium]|nr:KH domain-containing protein [Bacteroidales bacterium]
LDSYISFTANGILDLSEKNLYIRNNRFVGKAGSAIKKLGIMSRGDIEEFTGKKIFLDLNVKVSKDWRDNEAELKNFNYEA